jgi:hypothetical protein
MILLEKDKKIRNESNDLDVQNLLEIISIFLEFLINIFYIKTYTSID